MIERGTVLVLGAGASKPYGYPTGPELKRSIISGYGDVIRLFGRAGEGEQADQLSQAFNRSGIDSIDAFLSYRTEFSAIGKLLIAGLILNYEIDSSLRDEGDDWYGYLWHKLREDSQSIATLDLSGIRIVTFNYDRSLERFLLEAIQHTFNVPIEAACDKLASLKIDHVDGSLGSLDPRSRDYLPWATQGERPTTDTVHSAATRIQTIPEDRSSGDYTEIHRTLVQAQRICLLGFGFDRTNLQRLAAERTCRQDLGTNQLRRIIATAYKLTDAERMDAARRCGVDARTPDFIDGKTTETLRQTLALN